MMVTAHPENRRYSIVGIPLSVLVPLLGYVFTFVAGVMILKNDFSHEVDSRFTEDRRLHEQHAADIGRLETTRDKEVSRIVLALEKLGEQIRQDNMHMWKAIRNEKNNSD